MDAVDSILIIFAGIMAVIGMICFLWGLVFNTPLKWVFFGILIITLVSKVRF